MKILIPAQWWEERKEMGREQGDWAFEVMIDNDDGGERDGGRKGDGGR